MIREERRKLQMSKERMQFMNITTQQEMITAQQQTLDRLQHGTFNPFSLPPAHGQPNYSAYP